MAEVLKMFQLAQQHGMAKMQVRRGGIEPGFHAQRLAGSEGLLQFRAQLGLANDFRAAFLDVGQLFVNRGEGWHRSIIRNRENWRGLSTAVAGDLIQLGTRTAGAAALRRRARTQQAYQGGFRL